MIGFEKLQGAGDAGENKNVEQLSRFRDIDESLQQTSAEILGSVFTPEVLADWEKMPMDRRALMLNDYYVKAGAALGIETKGVFVEDLWAEMGIGTQGYNTGDGVNHLDIRMVADPENLSELLFVLNHEMRHQIQKDAISAPERFPAITKEQRETWSENLAPGHYIDGNLDFEGYCKQPVEADADRFAQAVMDAYEDQLLSKTASQEAEMPEPLIYMEKSVLDGYEDLLTDGLNRMEMAAKLTEMDPKMAQTGEYGIQRRHLMDLKASLQHAAVEKAADAAFSGRALQLIERLDEGVSALDQQVTELAAARADRVLDHAARELARNGI